MCILPYHINMACVVSFSPSSFTLFIRDDYRKEEESKTFASDVDFGLEKDYDDRNMEAILDECKVQLLHNLVVEVMQRFKHAMKSNFWLTRFPHNSRTYNYMMSVRGRTRQFETMVSKLLTVELSTDQAVNLLSCRLTKLPNWPSW
ncbi:hypothetical protein LR48_Vigan08g062500 [Vigna angularis]|uniref:Uncharacterized protein n=1 Tax=Phaseolus angularis TaxID=3914 RepID=A0A0L9V446_PHAAN|nr:hypothetical protein LR48_Vigan08g062500 [Vigna angularis]